ncbi:hypothetical protein KGF57_001032 [Candida theae]|uniref:Uncharacterized protein n=1 Tax=Candida theae TaxID=1198502 RepID=A0AAD5G0C6_9ASCO|nr:uncharacterized protein KGF57_001032 [Candida theae]KAI5964540.1 hypothetical protein KGF57_001032 [Candida theae]
MTLHEIDHNSSSNPQFTKSSYHSQLSKSLFRHYNESAQALQKSGRQTPDFLYQEPKLLNQQDYGEYNQDYGRNNSGYFVDRGAISVPSSRIETFYTDRSIEEEVHNLMQNYGVLHGYDQSLDSAPPSQGHDEYHSTSSHQHQQNANPVYQDEASQRDYPTKATQNQQYQNVSEYSDNYGQQDPPLNQNQFQISQHQQVHHEHSMSENHHPQQIPFEPHSFPRQAQNQQYENVQSSLPYSHSHGSHITTSHATQQQSPHFQSGFQYSPSQAHNEAAPTQSYSHNPRLNFPTEVSQTNQLPGTSTTKETPFEPKTKAKRGRPRKKPGFHLKLDGINKKVNLPNRLVSSSQSDSGTDYWNRTPSGNSHGPSRLSMALTRDDYDVGRDLSLHEGSFHGTVPGFDLTPSVDPPTKGYFELDHTPGIETVANGGFFSPATRLDGRVNDFNQSFETYLNKAGEYSNTQGEELDTNIIGFPIPEFQEDDAGDEQQVPIKGEFTPLEIPADSYVSQNDSSSGRASGGEVDNYSQSTYSAEAPQFNVDQYINSDEDPEVHPTVNQALSNHSSPHSAVSLGSDGHKKDPTTATAKTATKKKSSKGARCPVCDKFISRDLTRHMRIHNEVGRFQCVYPREMCNHKTQNFNRPYDYKKHLLHSHFKFDDARGKTAHTLGDKLPMSGECVACGARYIASEWLSEHVLTQNDEQRCAYVDATISIEQS